MSESAAAAPRGGFTLFEVMISLLVLTTGILATLALLPVGLKSQQKARAEMFAAGIAINLASSFHNPVTKMAGVGQMTPSFTGRPTYTADPALPPVAINGYGFEAGWAGQMRAANIYSSPYQFNAEHELGGWFKGALTVPPDIARRIDSENDDIQRLLDQGGVLMYPDPHFMAGLNSGAAFDKTMQTIPSSEMQRMVFAFTSLPQQNVLTSMPAESLPWYEVYPFPPQWLSMRSRGIETRRSTPAPFGTPLPLNVPGEYVVKTAITMRGRGTGDWTWGGGMVDRDDEGHSAYSPVRWLLPSREGADLWAGWFDEQRPLDDPDGFHLPEVDHGRNDWDKGWYQGNAFYHGRNWRYFADRMGGLWKRGNGIGSNDPFYTANAAEWAYISFQRLSGADARWLDQPRANYTTTYPEFASPPHNDNFNRVGAAGGRPGPIINPMDNGLTNRGQPYSVTVPSARPANSFPAHEPAKFLRAGWLPIRGLQNNDMEVRYDGNHWYLPNGDINQQVTMRTNQPQTAKPMATYEMRASYRDRAIDLWQAVMPANSGLAVLSKNTNPNAIVDVDKGGTMVDCDKYEYPPSQLDRFTMLMPEQISAQDWPIHPSQVMALSYLAHAAMLVTGYGEPFAQEINQIGQVNAIKIAWEGLNWTYKMSPEEASLGFTEVALDQGITKDALIVAADAAPGSSSITLRNDTPNPYLLYPGDVITFAESYAQWWVKWGMPKRGDGNIWAGKMPSTQAPGVYDNPTGTFPNQQYRLHSFRVVGFNGATGGAMPTAVPGNSTVTVQISPPLPQYPMNRYDARDAAPMDTGVSIHAGGQVRRITNVSDRIFARKVYEMCIAWAKRYASETPYDFGAPRMANHQTMMDKPLSAFDLFHDAANGTAAADGLAVRVPQNHQTQANTPSVYARESFYRWMVPNNHVPSDWFWNNVAPTSGRHDVSHLGPAVSNARNFDHMVHNHQLRPPTPENDQKRFWPVKPFAPFHRARSLSFWSVDWKAFEDAEIVPSAPIDWAKHNVVIWNYWGLFPNGSAGAYHTMPGHPESLYVWTDPGRAQRWVDAAGSEGGGWLWANGGTNYRIASGRECGQDVKMGHWGADRNGNGKLDIGPVPRSSRLRAVRLAEFAFYDPVLRVNASN